MGEDEACPGYRLAGFNDLMLQFKVIIIIEAQRMWMVVYFKSLYFHVAGTALKERL